MDFQFILSVFSRSILSVIIGGLIGSERARHGRAAGMRTHILVCLGSALTSMMSAYVSQILGNGGDILRIPAQVISGIGFLGAGCILVNGNKVRGLTTAAGLWTTACVGLATGMGYFFVSVTMTVFMLIAMLALRPIADRLKKKGVFRERELKITVKNRQSLQIVTECIAENECNILSMVSLEEDVFAVKISKTTEENISVIIGSLMENKEIKNVEIV